MSMTAKNWMGFILAVLAILAITSALSWALHTAYTDFMGECMQYRKHYECRVLYRGAQ